MTSQADFSPRPGARGRPSKRGAMLLRDRIQNAALLEFRRRGYAGSSIDGIARAASVSRTTIYALYSDKQTLFTEMIRTSIRFTGIFDTMVADDRAPALVLHDAMIALNAAYFREPNLEIIRLCIAEADRFPELVHEMYEMLALTLSGLTAYFDRLQRESIMPPVDSRCAARLFNMLSLGTLMPLFLNQQQLDSADRSGHLDLALRLFLNTCLPGAVPAGD